MGIVGQWAIGKLHFAAMALQFLQEQQLMDVVAGGRQAFADYLDAMRKLLDAVAAHQNG